MENSCSQMGEWHSCKSMKKCENSFGGALEKQESCRIFVVAKSNFADAKSNFRITKRYIFL